jgi:hypothetical protein
MVAGLDQLRAALAAALRRAILISTLALSACAQSEGSASPAPDAAGASGAPDEAPARARTPTEALAMFRAGLAVPTGLSGGAASREALVASFIRAVARSDTAAIRSMVLDRAEFAHLYYPSSPYNRPPMLQEAPLAWFLLLENSQKGVTRVFSRFAGQPLQYLGHRCDPAPAREGRNLFWRDCVVALRTDEGVATRRLFGSVIVRDGHFKFLSYANDY